MTIDNNAAERGLRPIGIGHRNRLFTSSDVGGRFAASAVEKILQLQQLNQAVIGSCDHGTISQRRNRCGVVDLVYAPQTFKVLNRAGLDRPRAQIQFFALNGSSTPLSAK